MGFLGVPFVGRGGVGKITSRLKLVIIMLETWNLVRMYTHISFNTRNILILLMSASFGKNQHFVSKIVRLFKAIVWELCNKFFSYIFSFCKIKGYYYWKRKFYDLCVRDPAFGLMTMTSQLSESSSNFFDLAVFLLSSLVTGPSFMSISWLELRKFLLIKDWPEIWKSWIPQPVFCPVSWDWDKLGIPNLARMSLIKCY